MVYSNTDIDSLEGVKEGSFTLKDLYPPIKKPLNTVKLAIDDSGIMVENTLLRNHLFYNPVGTLFCNTSKKEGLNGMNILSRNDQSSNTEPADVDGHGTFISGVAAGIALPNDDRFVTDPAMINIKQIHAKIFNTRDEGGDLFSALCGIHYSIGKKVKIINASWAATTYTSEEADAMKQVFCPSCTCTWYAKCFFSLISKIILGTDNE